MKEVFKGIKEAYPDYPYDELTLGIFNDTAGIEESKLSFSEVAIKILLKKEPIRVQLGWEEFGTMFEFMFVPLDNDWLNLRMTGCDDSFCFVGIVHFGNYAFRIEEAKKLGVINAGYIQEKLGIGMIEAVGLECFFVTLNNKISKLGEDLIKQFKK